MEDSRSDEELVTAYLKGDPVRDNPESVRDDAQWTISNGAGPAALEILLNRYSTIILSFLGGKSFFFKDKPYLDDVRQEVLIKVFKGIREFTSTGPGSFKRWVFKIAYFECLNHDKARRKGLKLTSEIFTEETTGIPDDLVFELTPHISDYEQADTQLQNALAQLSDEEIRLMKLVCHGVPHKDIIQRLEFRQYSLEALKQKIYNIRKRISKDIL
jgi:RNA polymerase sigma factor (sigma-70 family)